MTKQHYDESFGLRAPENYERFFVPAIGEPLAKDLLQQAALQPGEIVLDAACGTGIVTRLAAMQVGEKGTVTGLDINPGMLAVARSISKKDMPVEWREAAAEKMPLPDEYYDVVICQLSLQFMEDQSAALKEMHRVLVPGGRVYINVPGVSGELFSIFIDELDKNISSEAAGFASQVFSLNDPDKLIQLMEEAGFREVHAAAHEKTFDLPPPRDFLWQYVHSTPLASLISDRSKDTQQAFENSIVKRWKKFEINGSMKYKQTIITSAARK